MFGEKEGKREKSASVTEAVVYTLLLCFACFLWWYWLSEFFWGTLGYGMWRVKHFKLPTCAIVVTEQS